MSLGLYVYADNSSNDWCVEVPSDMAIALGMTAATTQPWLDAAISPRYATCRGTDGTTRTGIVQAKSVFLGLPGTTITLGAVVYTWISFQGESIPAIQSNPFLSPQGPMGPPGTNGTSGASPLTNTSGVITAAQIIASFATPQVLIAAPGGSSFLSLIRFSWQFNPGGTAFLLGGSTTFRCGVNAFANGASKTQMQSLSAYLNDVTFTLQTDVVTNNANQPLEFITSTAAFTTGNGTISWNALYQVLTL